MQDAVGDLPNGLKVEVGPERLVLTDGLQPFMFRTGQGTLIAQTQLSFPPNYVQPERNAFPGIPGNVVSRDGGKSWQRWTPAVKQTFLSSFEDGTPDLTGGNVQVLAWIASANQGIGPTYEGSALELNDGTILIIEWIADGPSSKGLWMGKIWESKDDFQTVSGPIPMQIHLPQARCGFDDGGRPYSGLTFHRTLLQLPGGDLLASAYCWFEGDVTPVPYQPSTCKFRCILLRSHDRGRHWNYVSTIAVNPEMGEEGFNEPVMVRISQGPQEGRLICLMRTGSRAYPIHQAWSDDEGATWSEPRELAFRGVDPDLIEMADGTLACSFGWRTADWLDNTPAPEHGNYMIFSFDQGDTWSAMTRLPMGAHENANHSTCYTAVREIEPNVLLVLYDIGSWSEPIRYAASREVRVVR